MCFPGYGFPECEASKHLKILMNSHSGDINDTGTLTSNDEFIVDDASNLEVVRIETGDSFEVRRFLLITCSTSRLEYIGS